MPTRPSRYHIVSKFLTSGVESGTLWHQSVKKKIVKLFSCSCGICNHRFFIRFIKCVSFLLMELLVPNFVEATLNIYLYIYKCVYTLHLSEQFVTSNTLRHLVYAALISFLRFSWWTVDPVETILSFNFPIPSYCENKTISSTSEVHFLHNTYFLVDVKGTKKERKWNEFKFFK